MAKKFFIRKSHEEILREEIRAQSITLQQLMLQQEEIKIELQRKRHLVRGENGKFVPKKEQIQEPINEPEDVYIPPADLRGNVSFKSLNTDTSELDNSAVEKAKEKKK